MKKTTFTVASVPGATRKSHHAYTHAVVVTGDRDFFRGNYEAKELVWTEKNAIENWAYYQKEAVKVAVKPWDQRHIDRCKGHLAEYGTVENMIAAYKANVVARFDSEPQGQKMVASFHGSKALAQKAADALRKQRRWQIIEVEETIAKI